MAGSRDAAYVQYARHISRNSRPGQKQLDAIDGFAVDYMRHYRSLEHDAEDAAETTVQLLCQQFGC
jgi:hypothetical protein